MFVCMFVAVRIRSWLTVRRIGLLTVAWQCGKTVPKASGCFPWFKAGRTLVLALPKIILTIGRETGGGRVLKKVSG